jgi:hypothetical protein
MQKIDPAQQFFQSLTQPHLDGEIKKPSPDPSSVASNYDTVLRSHALKGSHNPIFLEFHGIGSHLKVPTSAPIK